MELQTGRAMAALGLIVVLATLHVLSRDLLPTGLLTGVLRAFVFALAVWALVVWIRPHSK